MTVTNEFIRNLSNLESLSLHFRPKPEVKIEIASGLTNALFEMDDEERKMVLDETAALDVRKNLLSMSGYLAEAAVNTARCELITYALAMHAIEGFGKDCRENIRYLVLIEFSVKKIGVDFENVIRSVASVASPNVNRYLVEFCARDSSLNKLDAVGVKEDTSTGLFRFVPM
jgi:hypothetical protein